MSNATADNQCPDRTTLVEYLQGKLVPPDLETCESHVEACDSCHETLRGLNPSDTLSEVVSKAMESAAPMADDADVVENLVRQMSKTDGLTATAKHFVCSEELLMDRAAEVIRLLTPDSESSESIGILAGFRLLELIGAGGTGVVFRAHDLSLDRAVALKVLRPSLGPVARERFVAEARAAASIDHENVVTIYQVGQQERLAWIAMKWVPGETLENRLLREGPLDEQEIRQLVEQIANGLAEAHRQQLVHRDIKPANIWISDSDGKVQILDFGLVRITDSDLALTSTGMLAGTPSFMSPEQSKGQELDTRSDLFSLGCVIYQMITGALPFGSSTILATLQAIQTQQPQSPFAAGANASADLSDLTMALLEKEPVNRIQSADLLAECLQRQRGDWPVRIRSYASLDPIETKAISNKAISTKAISRVGSGPRFLGAAIVLGLLGLAAWAFAPQIIRIASDQGVLEIETDDENVSVEIRENGKVVRVLDAASEASFEIRSGHYEISATGKDSDTKFEVTPNALVLSRGGSQIVKVTRQKPLSESTSIAEASNAATEPQSVYEGKTFASWFQTAQTDKSAKMRSQAFLACSYLCETDAQFEQFRLALLQQLALQPITQIAPEKNRVSFMWHKENLFTSLLTNLPADRVVEFLKIELTEGSDLEVVSTLLAINKGLDTGRKEKAILRSLFEDAAEIIQLADQREAPLPSGVSGFFEMLKHNKTDQPESLYKGRSFGTWLWIAKMHQNPNDRVAAMIACSHVCKSDEQFEQFQQQLMDMHYLRADTKNRNGDKIIKPDPEGIFSNSLINLSKAHVIEFLKTQLKEGSDWELASALSAAETWDKIHGKKERALYAMLAQDAEVIRLVTKRTPTLPSNFPQYFELLKLAEPKKEPKPAPKRKSTKVIEGKTLAQWIKDVEADQDALKQAQAMKVCATFFASNRRNEELVAMLQTFLAKQPSLASFNKNDDEYNRFLGFAESLGKLSTVRTAKFFEAQLKEGSATTLEWTFAGLFARRDSRSARALKEELKSRAFDLLTLIAQRKKDGSVSYLFEFVVKRLLEKPLSVDSLNAIKSVLAAIEPMDLLKAIKFVPKNLITDDLFASTKAKLFAEETSATERDELIEALIRLNGLGDYSVDRTTAATIDQILAAVVANQLFDPAPVEFDEFQKMKIYAKKESDGTEYRSAESATWATGGFKEVEIKDPAAVPRKLLTEICERILRSKKKENPQEAAAKLYATITAASSSKPAKVPANANQFFKVFKIQQDLDALEKLSNKQHGEFSDFLEQFTDKKF